MAEKLSLPDLPASPMFIGDERVMTIEWQEFFRLLYKRVGGIDALTNTDISLSQVSEMFSTSVDYSKRINKLEKQLQMLFTTKSYSKEIQELLNIVAFEVYKPSEGGPISGVYTPALTNVSNISASTSFPAQYLRVGKAVTVSGLVVITPINTVATLLGVSLPIHSRLDNAYECVGVAFTPGTSSLGAAIVGDPANNRAEMQWIASGGFVDEPMYYTFTYLVL